MRRAFHIIGGDLLDEFRNVDACGALLDAGRIVAEQATVCFHKGCFLFIKGRMNIAEVDLVFFSGKSVVLNHCFDFYVAC
jgi:hypothetical protein